MLVAGLVLAGVAALVHVYIFFLESVAWTGDRARRTFGIESVEDAETMRPLAFNQGFYNLFLAIAVVLGIMLWVAGQHTAGITLVLTGAGSMAAAALVLLLSSPDKAQAALKQGIVPLAAVITVVVGLVL